MQDINIFISFVMVNMEIERFDVKGVASLVFNIQQIKI